MSGQVGKVYFVGAGPGDPKLITVKGMEALQMADVIIYDRLASPELLNYAREDVELIYCGKLPDRHTIPQDEINLVIVEKAKEGKVVVRLKGGDPSIFGRVGEEAERCVHFQIPYEIVPGVTAGIAAPIFAGIPLTHRDYNSSVAFVTGHRKVEQRGEIQWDKLATGVDTLVFYMGVKNIGYISEQLIQHGRKRETPVALIRWGTLPQMQETLVGTLENIVQMVEMAQFQAPAVIVVGEVVRLRDKLQWFQGEQVKEYEVCY